MATVQERNPGPGWVKVPKPDRNPGPGWVKVPQPELVPRSDRVVPTQIPEQKAIPKNTPQPSQDEGDVAWATQVLGEVEKNPDLREKFPKLISDAEGILGIGSQQGMAGTAGDVKAADILTGEADAMLEDLQSQLPTPGRELPLGEGFGNALGRGWAGMQGSAAGIKRFIGESRERFDQRVAESLGLDYEKDVAPNDPFVQQRREYIENAKKQSERANKTIASLPSSPSAQGLNVASLRFWTEGIGEYLPQLTAQMAGAILTGGSSVPLQMLAFAGVGGGSEFGGTYNAARESGATHAMATAEAALVASISTAVDLIPGSALLKKNPAAKRIFDKGLKEALIKRMGKGFAAKRIFDKGLKEALTKRMGKEFVKGFVAEGPTEMIQEAWGDTVQWLLRNDPEAFNDALTRYGRAFLLGGASGGGMAGVTGGNSNRSISNKDVQDATSQMKRAIDKGNISRRDAAKLGIEDLTSAGRMKTAKKRFKILEGIQDTINNLDAKDVNEAKKLLKAAENSSNIRTRFPEQIAKAEAILKENQDATEVPANQRGPEETGETGRRSPENRGGDLRRQGPDETGQDGAGQATTGQAEAQVGNPPISATEPFQVTTQPPQIATESSQNAPGSPQNAPQPEVTQSTKKPSETQEGAITEPELLPANAPWSVVKEEAAKLGIGNKATRPDYIKAINEKKIDDAAVEPKVVKPKDVEPKVEPPKDVAPQIERPGKTGIKVEALESQAAAEGVAPPSPAESKSAIEAVEDAVLRHSEDSDKKIQGRALQIIDDPDLPISSNDAADLAASLDYHRRKADDADDKYNDLMAEGKTKEAESFAKEVDFHREAEKTAAQAARFAGSQWSHIGHIYQLLIDKDGEAHVERTLRKANQGEDVEPGWSKKWSGEVSKSKKEQSKRGAEIEEENSTEAANTRLNELKKEIESESRQKKTLNPRKRGAKNRIVTQEKRDAAINRLKSRARKTGHALYSIPAKPAAETLLDLAIVASYHIEAGARSLADFTTAMVQDLGPRIKPHLNKLYQKARADYAAVRRGELREVLSGSKDIREQHNTISAMAKEILAENRNEDGSFIELEGLLDILHPELQEFSPDITRREVNDMLGGYGNYKKLSKDELDVAYRDRRGEARTTSQILDLEQKKAPKASGRESHKPSARERRNSKKVRQLKRQGEQEGWYESNADPEARHKSLRESRRTTLENEIEDLDAQIEAGKKTERQKSTPATDSNIESLIEQRNLKRDRLEAMDQAAKERETAMWEGEGGTVVDPELEAYLKSIESEIKSLEAKIKSGDVFPKKKIGRKSDQRTELANARLESLRAERDLVRKTLDPNYETNQKILRAERQAEREVAKLEAEKAKGFPLKEKPDQVPVTERLEKAKEKLESLRQERKEAQENELALRASIAQSTRNAVKVAEKLAKGDFAKKAPKPKSVWDDPEWQKAKDKELDLRRQLSEKIAEYEWEHAHPMDKLLYGGRVGGAAWKGWLAGAMGDFSYIGIQSGMVLGSPQHIASALLPTVKAMGSPKARARIDAQMQADPDYAKMKKWGLALREHGQRSTNSADIELFPTDELVDKIPGIAIGERGFSMGMNQIRFNLMKGLMWAYSKPDGRLLDSDTGPALARVVNALTMAWKPRSKGMQHALNASGYVFWAPSMYVARLQILTASPVWANRGADARVRKLAALQLIKGYAAIAMIKSAFEWFWGDEEQERSPLSSDFTKVVSGDVHLTMPTGMGQMVTLTARLMEQLMANITGREPKTSKGKRTQSTARSLVGTTVSHKVLPWWSMLFDLISKKDILGRPATLATKFADNATPLAMQGLLEGIEERGLGEGTAIGALGYFGLPSSIYNNSNPKSEETFLATLRRLSARMFGKDISGLKEEDMDKWVENKITWDSDLSQADRFLTPKQLKRAEAKVKEKKELVVQGVEPEPVKPVRKKHLTDAAYKKVLKKHSKKAERWKAKIEEFQDMRQFLNLSHEEAQKLLVNSYWKVKDEVKGSEIDKRNGKPKDAYKKRGKALAKLYGLSEKDFEKWYKAFKKGRRAARSKWEEGLKNTQ